MKIHIIYKCAKNAMNFYCIFTTSELELLHFNTKAKMNEGLRLKLILKRVK